MARTGTYMNWSAPTDGTASLPLTTGIHEECNMTVIDLSTDASTTVSAVPALLFGVYVNTVLSAHTVTLDDDTTVKITLPASLAAGSSPKFYGARFETSLVVNPNDSSTGSITVFWRPL